MKSVWKYSFLVNDNVQSVNIPIGGKPVHVAMQNGLLCLWCLVWENAEREDRTFVVHGTGHTVAPNETYIGTALDDPYVWHLFEVGHKIS